jgi:hypothetical protein
MSNALYNKGRQAFLEGNIAWLSNTIKGHLIDTGNYTVNLSTHDFWDDVGGSARVDTPETLGSKDATDGVADAGDLTFAAVAGPTSIEAVILYKDTGVESTSNLLAYIDTATGLPVTSSGGDIIVQWDNGSNKIFKL